MTDGKSERRLSYSIAELARATGLSGPVLYRAIHAGELRSFQVGRRRLVSAEAAAEFIASREAAGTKLVDTSRAMSARWPDSRSAA